jgi:hypothetical protein
MDDIVTKTAFAARARVSSQRVSQWLAAGQLFGEAIVGSGRHARIRTSVALEQLRRTLDPSQALGANGVASSEASGTVEAAIKAARLAQLELFNAKAREEASARNGYYTVTADTRQELGRAASRLLTMFDGALGEFANAIAAKPPASSREALTVLRTVWRDIRVRQATAAGEEAETLPPLVDEDVSGDSHI